MTNEHCQYSVTECKCWGTDALLSGSAAICLDGVFLAMQAFTVHAWCVNRKWVLQLMLSLAQFFLPIVPQVVRPYLSQS